jgi:DNA mismatch repair protein MutS
MTAAPPDAADPRLTPALRQYAEAKAAHPDCILLFRMGDFYEVFFDDAHIVSRELDLTLTARGKEKGEPIPMAGVPYHAAEGYVRRLVARGYHVAYCDQLEDPAQAKGVVRRGVTRVVTPGLLLDDGALDARAHNHLVALAISSFKDADVVAIAATDISTGDLRIIEAAGLDAAATELRRLSPAEVLVADVHAALLRGVVEDHGVACTVRTEATLRLERVIERAATRRLDWDARTARPRMLTGAELRDRLRIVEDSSLRDRAAVESAIAILLDYVGEKQGGIPANLDAAVLHRSEDYAVLDPASLANLEVFETMMGGRRQGSLVQVIDQTVTPAGARRLRTWLTYPLTDPARIVARQDAVTAFVGHPSPRESVRAALRQCVDVHRVASKLAAGQGGPRDLVALRRSLEALPGLLGALEAVGGALESRAEAIDPCDDLATLVREAIVDDPPLSTEDGPVVRPGYALDLDEIHALSRDGKDWILRYEARERSRTGIGSLKVRYNKVFGYYIEVTRSNLESVPADYIRKQTLANAERYYTPDLKEYEERILSAEDRRIALENRIVESVRDLLVADLGRLKRTADALAEVDVLAGLAELSHKRGYVAPVIGDAPGLEIEEGRHPVVETMVEGERFVPNSTSLHPDQRLIILTGPNMAGKSTVIRQVALIALLAQVGSHVPARSARIGVVDQIFSRVGASDNLARGHSTFMVEMSETAHILRHATARSLVVLDEIGRGTSTYDGISLAWAVAEFLHDRVGSLSLFATHYHELTELARLKPHIRNCSVAVKENGHDVVFLRRVVEGAANRSFGIQVAKLAGLPDSVLARAREILAGLEPGASDAVVTSGPLPARRARSVARGDSAQVSLFGEEAPERTEPSADPVLAELLGLQLDTLSPIEALNLLYALQRRARRRGRG